MFLRTVASLAVLMCLGFACDARAAKPPVPDAVLVAPSGEKLAIVFDDKHIYVDAGDMHVIATSSGGARYFKHENGAAIAEVKQTEDGFNVRAPDAKLLWKVRITGDKINVADNEDMQHAWSIKFKKDENVRVLDASGKEIGSIKVKTGGKITLNDARGKEMYAIESGRTSPGYGVLLMKNLPQELRYVLVGTLFVLND